MRAFGDYVIDGTASTMKEREYKDATDLVIQTSKRCVFDEVHVVNGNSTPEVSTDLAFPLRANDGSGNRQCIAVDTGEPDVAGALCAHSFSGGAGGRPEGAAQGYFVCVHGTQDPIHSEHTAHAPGRNSGQENVICFTSKDYGADASDDLSPTLRAGGHSESHANAGVPPAIAYAVALRGRDGGGTAELGDDVAHCLRASEGGGDKAHVLAAVDPMTQYGDLAGSLTARYDSSPCADRGQNIVSSTNMAVRRLMPVECEALQGFPPGWTRIPISHHAERKITTSRPENRWEPDPNGGWWLMSADGPRYKQIGNSMATPVMRWLGTRIRDYLKLQPYLELIG